MEQDRRYYVMAKLDPVKIAWIIRQKQKGTPNHSRINEPGTRIIDQSGEVYDVKE